jgi:serine/threonine protein kinase
MSYKDCKRLSGKGIETYFKKIRTLGAGGYSSVFEAEILEPAIMEIGEDLPPEVAIKEIKPLIDKHEKQMFINEVSMLKNVRLKHGLTFYGCLDIDNSLYVVTDVVSGKELFDLIVDGTVYDRYKVILNIALAIKELHDNGIAHRDIKPENIMVGAGNTVTIIDYGMICTQNIITEKTCSFNSGTEGYYDPQSGLSLENLMSSDWWAFGQVVAAMFLRKLLYDRGTHIYTREPLVGMTQPLKHLIETLNDPDAPWQSRPTASEIISTIHRTILAQTQHA